MLVGLGLPSMITMPLHLVGQRIIVAHQLVGQRIIVAHQLVGQRIIVAHQLVGQRIIVAHQLVGQRIIVAHQLVGQRIIVAHQLVGQRIIVAHQLVGQRIIAPLCLLHLRRSNNTGNAADFVNTILGIHNLERAAVGVPPLTWSDSLAASAQTWAEHMATINQMVHSDDFSYGENIAGWSHGNSPPGSQDTLTKMVESWAVEKKNWQGGVLTEENAASAGHYTQMVWKDTKQVGCGVAAASVNDYLVCQYSPTGNSIGKAPY